MRCNGHDLGSSLRGLLRSSVPFSCTLPLRLPHTFSFSCASAACTVICTSASARLHSRRPIRHLAISQPVSESATIECVLETSAHAFASDDDVNDRAVTNGKECRVTVCSQILALCPAIRSARATVPSTFSLVHTSLTAGRCSSTDER